MEGVVEASNVVLVGFKILCSIIGNIGSPGQTNIKLMTIPHDIF